MKRREFLGGLGGLTALALTARAQPPALPVVGFLGTGSPVAYQRDVDAFQRGLRDAGYIDGRNVAIEYRWAEGEYAKLPPLAGDLV